MSTEEAKAFTPPMNAMQSDVIVNFLAEHNFIAAGKALGLDHKKTAEVNWSKVAKLASDKGPTKTPKQVQDVSDPYFFFKSFYLPSKD